MFVSVSFLNDVFEFDLARMEWTELTGQIEGIPPVPRYDHGLTIANGVLYIFGGLDESGEILGDSATFVKGLLGDNLHDWVILFVCTDTLLNDLKAVAAPRDILWSNNAGMDIFIETYDWDLLVFHPTSTITLSSPLDLCTGILPCSLSINGIAGGTIFFTKDTYIACDLSIGCAALALNSVQVLCDLSKSSSSPLQISSTVLDISNSSFNGCSSLNYGGVIESYGDSTITINSSVFMNVSSDSFGGAISVFGGKVKIFNSQFYNCSSKQGGGAISAASFSCTGAKNYVNTDFYLSHSSFERCFSEENGGGILMSGQSVTANIYAASFSFCGSNSLGGAISLNYGASLVLTSTLLLNNYVDGLGGGALHASDSNLFLQGLDCKGNTAMAGGGGLLYWSGDLEPEIRLWCRAGSMAKDADEPISSPPECIACPPGTFQTSDGTTFCTSCKAGTYLTQYGASSLDSCISCVAGTYSTLKMSSSSSSCLACERGKFSNNGSDSCQPCHAGSYSSVLAASSSNVCTKCDFGTYSTVVAASESASCLVCKAGTFSLSGADTCSVCRAGTYSSMVRATSPIQCIDCDVGKFSNQQGAVSSASCEICPKGTYAVNKYFTYTMEALPWIEAEKACAASGGHLASIESEKENIDVLNLVPIFHDYWIGYHYNKTFGIWEWTDGSNASYSNWAVTNPKSGSDLYSCVDFPSYSSTTVNSSGLLAFWPYFSENYGVYPNAGPYSAPTAAWYTYDCGNAFAWVVGYVCSFSGSTTCAECDAGSYSTALGASSLSSCVSCPAGTNSSHNGATSCSNISNFLSHKQETQSREHTPRGR